MSGIGDDRPTSILSKAGKCGTVKPANKLSKLIVGREMWLAEVVSTGQEWWEVLQFYSAPMLWLRLVQYKKPCD